MAEYIAQRTMGMVYTDFESTNIAKFRDPMNKPLVTAPRDLTSEMQDRMRKLFQERTGR